MLTTDQCEQRRGATTLQQAAEPREARRWCVGVRYLDPAERRYRCDFHDRFCFPHGTYFTRDEALACAAQYAGATPELVRCLPEAPKG